MFTLLLKLYTLGGNDERKIKRLEYMLHEIVIYNPIILLVLNLIVWMWMIVLIAVGIHKHLTQFISVMIFYSLCFLITCFINKQRRK